MSAEFPELDSRLVGDVLKKLDAPVPVTHSFNEAEEIFKAWCLAMPFDNAQKMLALAEKHPGPLPGHYPKRYFDNWLEHGTGGTCWATAIGVGSLFQALGFEVKPMFGTMRRDEKYYPNPHGSVGLNVDGNWYWLDTSMAATYLLPLEGNELITTPLQPLLLERYDDREWIQWTPMARKHIAFAFDRFATMPEMHEQLEISRTESRFNDAVNVRVTREHEMRGVADGWYFERDEDGNEACEPIADLIVVLTERIGFSQDIAERLAKISK